jgi:glycosyltransferase involved in cell wall biosynthesis
VHADLLALPLGRLLRVPVVMSTKHGFNEFRDHWAFALVDRTIGRLARPHLAISHGLARYLAETEGFPESAFEVVHYGLEAGPPPEVAPPTGPRFGIVGRLVPIKGHRFLLDAVAELRADVPDLRVEIAGTGPLEAELRSLIARLGVADAVELLGHVAPPWPVMERALAVVVPSLGEGFGMVALEAMLRGRAVIASDVGGLPEIVEHGVTGLVVPPRDPAALAAAMRELASDPARAAAMGVAGRRRAETVFSLERCVERHVEVVRTALRAVR